MREIVIVEYDPRWPGMFAEEASGLRQAFGARSVSDVAEAVPPLAALGWEQGVFAPDPERHLYFKKHNADRTRTHQLHVYAPDHPAATAHLLFRDYLRLHSKEAARYGDLKRCPARRYRHDVLAYCDAKTAFVEAVLAKAHG